jgi:hypothetical protein
MHLEITSRESELLEEVLGTYLRNLHSEIHHTEDSGYKKELKAQEEGLQSLRERLLSLKVTALTT